MKPRTLFMLPVVLLLVVGAPIVSAEPEGRQEVIKDAPPEPQIAKWISQLGSDKFTVRDQATQTLEDAMTCLGRNHRPSRAKWVLPHF